MAVHGNFDAFVRRFGVLRPGTVVHHQEIPKTKMRRGSSFVLPVMGKQFGDFIHFFHVRMGKEAPYEQQQAQKRAMTVRIGGQI
jgi:hypothetical protein